MLKNDYETNKKIVDKAIELLEKSLSYYTVNGHNKTIYKFNNIELETWSGYGVGIKHRGNFIYKGLHNLTWGEMDRNDKEKLARKLKRVIREAKNRIDDNNVNSFLKAK